MYSEGVSPIQVQGHGDFEEYLPKLVVVGLRGQVNRERVVAQFVDECGWQLADDETAERCMIGFV
jgi:hypothetical protein